MTRHEPRLRMKPADAATGSVDGDWWPPSLDPTTAFPELVSALQPWLGPVSRIAYHLGLWEPAPRKQTVDGRMIRYEGFHTIDPHTVTAIGTNTRRVSLLVVPPPTPDGVARAVLLSAAGSDSTATVADILASNDVPPHKHAPADTTRPEPRWEADGGSVPNTARHPTTSPSPTR
jgi:uncharacterized protein DUF5994